MLLLMMVEGLLLSKKLPFVMETETFKRKNNGIVLEKQRKQAEL